MYPNLKPSMSNLKGWMVVAIPIKDGLISTQHIGRKIRIYNTFFFLIPTCETHRVRYSSWCSDRSLWRWKACKNSAFKTWCILVQDTLKEHVMVLGFVSTNFSMLSSHNNRTRQSWPARLTAASYLLCNNTSFDAHD